jgi:hypothetical protein
MGERFSDIPRYPAAMPLALAAEYCGLSPDRFKQRCPVKPISFGSSTRGDRWLRQRIDEWLLSLDRNEPEQPVRRRLGDRLGGQGATARP